MQIYEIENLHLDEMQSTAKFFIHNADNEGNELFMYFRAAIGTRGIVAEERRHILVAVLATQLLQVDELLLHLSALASGALHGEQLTALDYSENVGHKTINY